MLAATQSLRFYAVRVALPLQIDLQMTDAPIASVKECPIVRTSVKYGASAPKN